MLEATMAGYVSAVLSSYFGVAQHLLQEAASSRVLVVRPRAIEPHSTSLTITTPAAYF